MGFDWARKKLAGVMNCGFRKWKCCKDMGRIYFSQSGGGSRPQLILDSGEGVALQGKIEGYLIWRGDVALLT